MSVLDNVLALASGLPKAGTAPPQLTSPAPRPVAPPQMPPASPPPARADFVAVPQPVKVPRWAKSANASEWLWSLDAPLLKLSRTDTFTVRDACAGVHIFGANGSGKTSGSGRTLAHAYLKAGFGGLVLCVKADEADLWRRYGEETGRSGQMIFVSPDNPWRFNPIQYELLRAGDPATKVENILKLLTSLLEQSGREASSGEAQFWQNAAELVLRNTLMVLAASRSLFTLADVQAFIDGAPRSDAEAQSAGFDATPCGRDLELARQAYTRAGRLSDFQVVDNYWRVQFPRIPERTRGSVVMTLQTLLQDMLSGTLRELFATATNFFPEDTAEGAVVVMDLPAFATNANLMAQLLFKTVWQQAMIRRAARMGKRARPVFLWCDEAQLLATERDTDFLSICRSAKVAPVYMTQSMSSYSQRLGKGNAEHTAHALMSFFQHRVFHALSDPPTIQYAQSLFGKTVRVRGGANRSVSSSMTTTRGEDYGRNGGSSSGESWSTNSGWSRSQSKGSSLQLGSSDGWSESEQLEDALFAQDFTRLAAGGPENRWRVQAFVFATAKTWRATGTTCLPAIFDQRA